MSLFQNNIFHDNDDMVSTLVQFSHNIISNVIFCLKSEFNLKHHIQHDMYTFIGQEYCQRNMFYNY